MRFTKKMGIVLLGLTVLAGLAVTMACQKKAETPAAEVRKAVNEFEGVVRVGLGRYMYLSTAQGFDIVLPGFDAASVAGKTIKVKGNLLPDHPPVFLADSVESGGQTIYTRNQDFAGEDFVDIKVRETVPALAVTGLNKPEEWEGKGQVKVYGQLQKGDVNSIVLADDKGKEIAKIIVDNISTYSNYYIQKLRLFDKFWFYITVKDSVDKKDRAKTKTIFHADVTDVGLY
ncbi:MAG TPA: hypothetical protein VLJ16_02595 [Acidobacteriota bacterium]|nr:hypothetical protein [Acidobacteriota bacterium]